MTGREWNRLRNDEIFAIWSEYLRTDGLTSYDPLRMDTVRVRGMRLTPMEIIRLVDELIDRLEINHEKDQ